MIRIFCFSIHGSPMIYSLHFVLHRNMGDSYEQTIVIKFIFKYLLRHVIHIRYFTRMDPPGLFMAFCVTQ